MERIRKEKPKVFLIAGFPASGKTSMTKVGQDVLNAEIISCDDVYFELSEKETMWRSDERIFDTAHDRARDLLLDGKNVMIDSVYMDKQTRKYAIDALQDVADVHMVVMDTPIEICKERNAKRVRPVEDWVYDTLGREQASPSLDEGLKSIHHFDNLTDIEKEECRTGCYGKQGQMTDRELGEAIVKVRDFLHGVAKDTGVTSKRGVPERFEKFVSLVQKDEERQFE